MKIKIGINSKSINDAIKTFKKIKSQIPEMKDELLRECCIWVRERANMYLDLSGLNSGLISEIKDGWLMPEKKLDGRWVLSNFGSAYSVEFGIGIKGQGTYEGEKPFNYEYNVESRYKNSDGSWIFRIQDINKLDIMEQNVLPNSKTGEINYQEGRTIRTQGQQAVMFCYNAIIDLKNQKIAETLWEKIKKKYWGK